MGTQTEPTAAAPGTVVVPIQAPPDGSRVAATVAAATAEVSLVRRNKNVRRRSDDIIIIFF